MVDHILLGSPDGSVTTIGAWVHAGPVWRIMSDHYPLVAEFSVTGGRGDEGLILTGNRPPGANGIELDLTDKKLELRFSRGMVRMMASEELAEKSRHDPAAALEYISLETVKWVKKISGSKKGGKRARKNGWSPQFYRDEVLFAHANRDAPTSHGGGATPEVDGGTGGGARHRAPGSQLDCGGHQIDDARNCIPRREPGQHTRHSRGHGLWAATLARLRGR